MRIQKKLKQITKVLNGFNEGALDIEATISDVITDLQHFCDSKDLDFSGMIQRADGNYIVETTQWAKGLPLTEVPRYVNREFGDDRCKQLIRKRFKREKIHSLD